MVKRVLNVKVLRKKTGNSKEKQSLPFYSHTENTKYILEDKNGDFKQLREYVNHRACGDLDFGVHNGKTTLHYHTFNNNGHETTLIIIDEGGEIENIKMYNIFKDIIERYKINEKLKNK